MGKGASPRYARVVQIITILATMAYMRMCNNQFNWAALPTCQGKYLCRMLGSEKTKVSILLYHYTIAPLHHYHYRSHSPREESGSSTSLNGHGASFAAVSTSIHGHRTDIGRQTLAPLAPGVGTVKGHVTSMIRSYIKVYTWVFLSIKDICWRIIKFTRSNC